MCGGMSPRGNTSASPHSAPIFVPPMVNASHSRAMSGSAMSAAGLASAQPSRAPSRYSRIPYRRQMPAMAVSSPSAYSVPYSVGCDR